MARGAPRPYDDPVITRRRATRIALVLVVGASLLAAAPSDGDGPSWQMRLATLYLRASDAGLPRDGDAFARHVLRRPKHEAAPIPAALRRRHVVVESRVAGRRVVRVTPAGESDARIVYLHGGGYVSEMQDAHWDVVDQLAARTGAVVVVPYYPLAPRHVVAEAVPFVVDVVRDVRAKEPWARVVLAGDSAGGGLAVAAAYALRDRGVPIERLVLFAPWLDAALTNPQAAALEDRDVLLKIAPLRRCAEMWAGDLGVDHPYVSPLFGDPRGLPPVDLFVGGEDLLAPDARAFAERVRAAGGVGRLVEAPGAFHVYVAATFTPEARRAYDAVAAALAR